MNYISLKLEPLNTERLFYFFYFFCLFLFKNLHKSKKCFIFELSTNYNNILFTL